MDAGLAAWGRGGGGGEAVAPPTWVLAHLHGTFPLVALQCGF